MIPSWSGGSSSQRSARVGRVVPAVGIWSPCRIRGCERRRAPAPRSGYALDCRRQSGAEERGFAESDGALRDAMARGAQELRCSCRPVWPVDRPCARPKATLLPANQVLQSRIGYLLTRPVGRPPHHVRRFHANFSYQAGTWTKPRRVIAKVEWHPGELYPRVGFIVTNMSRPAERVVAFYNKRGTCEQWIKEGKGAIKWTRLSCRTFAANAVRLQLHALAYNLANLLRTLATPEPMSDWSLTTLKEKLIKIGAKVVSHGRYIVFQMAEVAIPRLMFQEILRLIAELRPQPPPAPA